MHPVGSGDDRGGDVVSVHTPGPWTMKHEAVGIGCGFNENREFVVGPDGKEVSGTIGHATELFDGATSNGRPVDHSYHLSRARPTFRDGVFPHSANAHLIAAAPELLEALVECLEQLVQYEEGGWLGEGWRTRVGMTQDIARARDAIAKATP